MILSWAEWVFWRPSSTQFNTSRCFCVIGGYTPGLRKHQELYDIFLSNKALDPKLTMSSYLEKCKMKNMLTLSSNSQTIQRGWLSGKLYLARMSQERKRSKQVIKNVLLELRNEKSFIDWDKKPLPGKGAHITNVCAFLIRRIEQTS